MRLIKPVKAKVGQQWPRKPLRADWASEGKLGKLRPTGPVEAKCVSMAR